MPSSQPSTVCGTRRLALVETALIFAVFFLQGAWPVPDSNETHYLAKAIHYWNPDWLPNDFFLGTPGAHRMFDLGFGWLSLWLPPLPLAWTGRVLTWLLLAWAWRRLSWAIVPRAWWSVLTALLFGWLTENCHMAGEWVVGGVEAKGFAYVLVFLGIEAIVRNRWNRGLLLLGSASAIHVVVGGWAAVAAGIGWLWLRATSQPTVTRNDLRPEPTSNGEATPRLRSLWPGLVGGLLLALPGIVPGIALDWDAGRNTALRAHEIYVFERLPHHLVVTEIRPWFIGRLALLWGVWLLLGRWERRQAVAGKRQNSLRRLRAFVAGAVAISLAGAAVSALIAVNRALAAQLLRFYWFRLTDIALPLAVALEVAWLLAIRGGPLSLWERVRARTVQGQELQSSRMLGAPPSSPAPPSRREARSALARGGYGIAWLLVLAVASYQLGVHAVERAFPGTPRAEKMPNAADWIAACQWVASSGKVPADARFLVPHESQTFSWYSHHGDVVTWKDVPQDANGLVTWWQRIEDIYATGLSPPEPRWYGSLADLGAARLCSLGGKYGATYAICQRTDPLLKLDIAYENPTYVIYRLR